MTYQRPLPTAPTDEPSLQTSHGGILIPTEEGKMVALHEPVKRVSHRGQEIELRRLTPEEKVRRRRKTTLCMILFATVVILTTLFILLRR